MDCKQEEIKEIISYYKQQRDFASQENLTSLLREVQELLGYIPTVVQEQIAQALSIKPMLIQQLIKRYPSLRDAPATHRMVLCLGPTCSHAGGASLHSALLAAIKGLPFTLTTGNCLKSCGTTPNLTIDNDLYTHVTIADIATILSHYL